MNYVRTILIAIALLNMHYSYNGQAPLAQNTDSAFDDIDSLLQPVTVEDSKTETKETNNLQTWNDHLESLTSDNDNWDTTTNNPTPNWKTKAFDLAEEVLKHDKSLAETLKTDFINALNKKTTQFIHITNLITEFSNFIDNLLSVSATSQETNELTPPAPVVPEPIIVPTPEPVTEPIPLQTETPQTTFSEQGETTPTVSGENNSEANQAQLEQSWKDQLKKVAQEGENWVQIDDILIQTYQAAKELLRVGKIKENTLQEEFKKALLERPTWAKIKPLYPLDLHDTMYSFNNSIGIPQNQFDQPYRFPEPSMFEPIGPDRPQQGLTGLKDERVEKLQKALDEKDAKFKAEQKKAEEDRMILRKAAQEALEKQALTEQQVRRLAEAQNTAAEASKKLEKEYEDKRKKDLEEINAAKALLMQHTQQLAVSQKADAEKGMFAAFTQGLSDWWYGTSAPKPGELSSTKQDELLSQMVKNVPHHSQLAAKQAFKRFQNTLLGLNTPTPQWIFQMDESIKDVVITYKLMTLPDVLDFVQNVLQKSGKISPASLSSIMSKIQAQTKQELAEEQRQKEAKQQVVQRRQEKKEQILLAEQRARAEKERIEAEKQKRIHAANTYKQEKKHWYELLDKVAQNKQATPQDNHAHMQAALQKSQSLLQLASEIPHKNKPAISQKLKQKFSVALLEQQKNGAQGTNVYHNMDLFNKEINKMLD